MNSEKKTVEFTEEHLFALSDLGKLVFNSHASLAGYSILEPNFPTAESSSDRNFDQLT